MAEAVGAHGVHVTWEQPTDHICQIGFSVSFTPERGGGTLFTGVGPSASEYTVQNLLCNTAYVFNGPATSKCKCPRKILPLGLLEAIYEQTIIYDLCKQKLVVYIVVIAELCGFRE